MRMMRCLMPASAVASVRVSPGPAQSLGILQRATRYPLDATAAVALGGDAAHYLRAVAAMHSLSALANDKAGCSAKTVDSEGGIGSNCVATWSGLHLHTCSHLPTPLVVTNLEQASQKNVHCEACNPRQSR